MRVTDKERLALVFIETYHLNRGRPPSWDEIRDAVGFESHSSITYHMRRLRQKGYLAWEDGDPRTIRVTKKAAV